MARQLRYDSPIEKIAETISQVFSCAFEAQDFPIDICMNVALKIKEKFDEEQGRNTDYYDDLLKLRAAICFEDE